MHHTPQQHVTLLSKLRRSLTCHNRIVTTAKTSITWASTHYLKYRSPKLSAHHRLSPAQKLVTSILALGILFLLAFHLVPTLIAINILFCVFCLLTLLVRIYFIFTHLRENQATTHNRPFLRGIADLPVITILVPLYQEADSLPHLVKALDELIYPSFRLDIKILLEEDDAETRAAASALCTASHYDIIIVPPDGPRTKPKACNHGLWRAKGDYITIYDAEDRPEADQLLKAVSTFHKAHEKTACLQARLNYYNREQSLLTRLFSLEYTMLFDLILPGLRQLKAPLLLGGTSNFFRTRALIKVGGWDPYNVTEDADIGLRLHAAGYETDILNSTTWEEAVSTPKAWLKQRSRWIKGYLQSWLVHTRYRPPSWQHGMTINLLMGGVIISSLLNPIFWIFYASWLAGSSLSIAALYPGILMHLTLFNLLAGNMALIYMFMIAPLQRRWYHATSYALAMPLYWLMQSVAGYMALKQFFTNPFYWEKTTHYPQTALAAAKEETPIRTPRSGV
jgi:cellulose synthase/poly-beta-1,6-N-acetylglucosamine synthase-like glycosyltransferase